MANDIKNLEDFKEKIKNSFENDSNFKFKIKVNANSKNNSIEFSEDTIKIKIKERALEGRANKAIIEFLAEILKHQKSKIKILNGHKSSIKTIEIVL